MPGLIEHVAGDACPAVDDVSWPELIYSVGPHRESRGSVVPSKSLLGPVRPVGCCKDYGSTILFLIA